MEIGANFIKSIIEAIRGKSKTEIAIASLFLIPILLGVWLFILNKISALDQHDWLKARILIAVAVIYLLLMVIIMFMYSKDERLKRAKKQVLDYLKHRGHASFMAIREDVNNKYDDDFLRELVYKYPETFRILPIKRPSLGKTVNGITLVEDSETSKGSTSNGKTRSRTRA